MALITGCLDQDESEIRGAQTIDRQTVPTLSTEYWAECGLKVEAGTNGYCGGDSGHGGRTYIRLENAAGFDIRATTIPDGGVEIVIGGDAELRQVQNALIFAARAIESFCVESALTTELQTRFQFYRLTDDDRKCISRAVHKSRIVLEHFSWWLHDLTDGVAWKWLCLGGVARIFESYFPNRRR